MNRFTRKVPRDFSLDVEAAAFSYLMAKTEAIMTHNQDRFFQREEESNCGTAGCLAGHACYYAAGCEPRPENLTSSGYEATASITLFGTKTSSLVPESQLDFVFNKYIIAERDEEKALRNFRRLILALATEEEAEQFKDLISLDPENLRKTVPA